MENFKKNVYLLGSALVVFWVILYFLPKEDNFKIKNGKIITGVFKGYRNTKASNNGYIDYNYNGNYFYNNKSFLGCLCFSEGQSILIKIDTLDPENYIFLPDTFIVSELPQNENVSLSDFICDTLEAYDLDYFQLTQCLKFNIRKNGEVIHMEKLLGTKPHGEKMSFIYFNNDINENYLRELN